MSDDPYLYPGTDVLRNKLGIHDREKLARFEYGITATRALGLKESPIEGKFDLKHLQAIHKDLFKDVYDWAGQNRTVMISKGQSTFAHPDMIESYANSTVFKGIRNDDYLRNMDQRAFAGRLAHHYAEINALHPFREGNGRSSRIFIEQLAEKAGYKLDISKVDARTWNEAARDSFNGKLERLTAIFTEISQPMRDIAHDGNGRGDAAKSGGLAVPTQRKEDGFAQESTAKKESERAIAVAAAAHGIKSIRDGTSIIRDMRGEVAAVSSHHVLLKLSDDVAVRLEKARLDKPLREGDKITVVYGKDVSRVLVPGQELPGDRQRETGRGMGR